MAGDSNHLAHQVANQLTGGRVLQEQISLRVQGYRHAIERHIPHGLLPTGLIIGNGARLDTSIDKIIQDSSKDALILTGVVGEIDAAIALMIHATRLRLGRTDECKTSYQLDMGKHLLHIGFYPNAILYQYHNCMFLEQWWQEISEQMIIGGFQTHNHHIALRHVSRILINVHMVKMERAVAGVHLHATLFHKPIITMRQEMNLLSAICQFAAIIATNGASTYYSVSHQR